MAKMKRADIEKQMAVNHGRCVNEKKVKEMKRMENSMAKRPPSGRKNII